jgi:NDP-sugar pyrophosphorylase family protein
VRALILTAGLGTRLRPLTDLRAKAALPVNGEALVRRIVRWLGTQGIHDLVLNLHHRPETIAAAVGDGSDLGARVRYSWEHPVLGSAGGPRHALPLLPGERFLIVNGDTLTSLDVSALVATHDRSGSAVTMALIPNPRPDKYGGVLVSGGRVTGFSRAGSSPSSYHFIGVQVARPGAFASLPDGVPAESVNALYPRLIAADAGAIAAHVCDAAFQDIGTPADYLATCLELAAVEGDRLTGARARIDPSASLTGTIVWDDVVIGARARLDSCIAGDGARVPGGAVFERCALVPAGARRPEPDEHLEGDLLVRPFAPAAGRR